MAAIAKCVMIIILLALGAIFVFISQLYSPTILWIVSYSILIGSIALGIFAKNRRRVLVISFILSLIINARYLSYIPFGNPIIYMALYGLGLVLMIWAVIFFVAEVVASMTPQRRAMFGGKQDKGTPS
jgi:hypothetical protein